MVAKAELYLNPASHQYIAPSSAAAAKLKGEKKKEWESLNSELKKFASLRPPALPIATAFFDISSEAPRTYVLRGGAYDAPTDEVVPAFLTLLNPGPTPYFKTPSQEKTGRRSALAHLLADPENPLTARVMVNRIWQHHFGKGLVTTPSDFGLKGERPTHPELLDWLARQFVENGWSIKKMHKLIMLSATYQQDSKLTQPPRRLIPTINCSGATPVIGSKGKSFAMLRFMSQACSIPKWAARVSSRNSRMAWILAAVGSYPASRVTAIDAAFTFLSAGICAIQCLKPSIRPTLMKVAPAAIPPPALFKPSP